MIIKMKIQVIQKSLNIPFHLFSHALILSSSPKVIQIRIQSVSFQIITCIFTNMKYMCKYLGRLLMDLHILFYSHFIEQYVLNTFSSFSLSVLNLCILFHRTTIYFTILLSIDIFKDSSSILSLYKNACHGYLFICTYTHAHTFLLFFAGKIARSTVVM